MLLLSIDEGMPNIFLKAIEESLEEKYSYIIFFDNMLISESEEFEPNIFPFSALKLEEDGLISYFPYSKQELLKNSNELDYFLSPYRQKMKPGKILYYISETLKKHLPRYVGISTQAIEKVSLQIQSLISQSKSIYKIEEVEGEVLAQSYDKTKYYPCSGSTLELSCMAIKPISFFEIYSKNPDKVKGIVVKKGNWVIGRAIVWICDDNRIIMDRPYYGKEEVLFIMRNYATAKGWDYKSNISAKQRDLILQDGNKIEPIVTLKEWKFGKYPYMDTFKYLDLDTGKLSVTVTSLVGKGLILSKEDGSTVKINVVPVT